MYKMENVCFSFGKKNVLKQINLQINQGEFVVLLGCNGSGKSTLLKCFSAALKVDKGEVLYNGKDISHLSMKEKSRKRTVLSQSITVSFPFSVLNIVQLGLFNYMLSEKQKSEIAALYLKKVGLEEYKDTLIQNLSGGQQQRVHIARILCQLHKERSKIIFVDEPTSALDISYQIAMLDLFKQCQKQSNHSIFCILHDVNLALLYADKIIILDKEEITYMDKNDPYEIKPILEDIYKIPLDILQNGRQHHIVFKV